MNATSTLARAQLVGILERDLIGPRGGAEETISDKPSDRYITGALYPKPPRDEDDKPVDEDDADPESDEVGGPGDAIDLGSMQRPTSLGLSVLISGKTPEIQVHGGAAQYEWQPGGNWKRKPISFDRKLQLLDGLHQTPESDGLSWHVRTVRAGDRRLVSVVLSNTLEPAKGREAFEAAVFFQVSFSVTVSGGQIEPRDSIGPTTDEDGDANRLIYRNSREYATGHTCSVDWQIGSEGVSVETTWMPRQVVPSLSADGHEVFAVVSKSVSGSEGGAFDAERLAGASPEELIRLLKVIPDAYGSWLAGQAEELKSGRLDASQASQGQKHLDRASGITDRMRRGIDCLANDAAAREAFQLAQRAMLMQARWRKNDPNLTFGWRPFQLAFQLLSIPGIAAPIGPEGKASTDRLVLDLLWFPTGGGKTEAYLGLIAFTLFLRRLRAGGNPDDGAGVGSFMRYTLRLLSTQQFERAARVMIACDQLRRESPGRLGSVDFSVGLWVGNEVTPNKLEDAAQPEGRKRAKQLAACPVCGRRNRLAASYVPAGGGKPARFAMSCQEQSCPVYGRELPVWTVDEDIYRERPSLIIATVDKFAQIVRRPEIRSLLRVDDNPPDLILQDELHLISGPLGTVVGLYEVAVERLCSLNGVPPKIIGSTATIRRAEDQVRSLFARPVAQFPPAILDPEDTCFAVVDRAKPGRVYVGLTSAGRSPKYLLQGLSAVLLQGVMELPDTVAARDPFWTLLLYFNSLRELGGALVMLFDDVNDSIKVLAKLGGSDARPLLDEPMEMTSRTGSGDLPEQLKRLEEQYPDQQYGPVLATNMISVGVDVSRLGLMVVNGQPKSMAEYIQATSRVGREDTPGMIVTCYNAGRPRDRSHFETFRGWHQALYRDVEASSVTPFAPRARDRALHAPLVAMVRHTLERFNNEPVLDEEATSEVNALIELIVDRCREVDPMERAAVRNELRAFADQWLAWRGLEFYWVDKKKQSLLISAEHAAGIAAVHGEFHSASRPTPGSMRNVEPSVVAVLKEALSDRNVGVPHAS
jgi:hypothetical protein